MTKRSKKKSGPAKAARRRKSASSRTQTTLPYEILEVKRVLASLFPTFINGEFTLGNGPDADSPYDLINTFELESNPTATKTIYIDNTGHHSVDNNWGHDIMFDPFDTDGNPASFSDDELIELQLQFQNMAEDFLPFDVNITTKDPGLDALLRNGPNDNEYGIRLVNTQPTDEFGGFCGIAFLNSFGSNIDNPVFTVCNGAINGALVHSHEIGHALGLNHDGLDGSAYHPGANDWGPLMGAPFGSRTTQWSDGNYAGSTNTEDDFEVITTRNGFGFRADDYGSSIATASEMTADENGDVFFWGIVEQNTDVDVFEFTTTAGDVVLNINAFQEAANLDILATIRDQNGNILHTSDSTTSMNAAFDVNLDAGTYYLTVEGTGNPGIYNDYGSVGLYTVEGIVNIVSGLPVGEVGHLDAVTDVWQTVQFLKTYEDPVVVAGPASRNGAAPLNVRIRNVTSTSFEIHVDEWEYDDGRHRNPESVDYLVVEAGEYVLEDGSIIMAGNRTNQTHRWTSNSLSDAFNGVSEPPVILTQTVTENDATSVTTRTRRISRTEFQIKLQEEQAYARGSHDAETVSWIAIQQNVGVLGFSKYEAGRTDNVVDHNGFQMGFQNDFDQPPAFLASMNSYNGGDTATLRYTSLTADSAGFFVQEERSSDAEMFHLPESVGYLAIEIGEIYGVDNQRKGFSSTPSSSYDDLVGNLSAHQGDYPDYSEALKLVRARDIAAADNVMVQDEHSFMHALGLEHSHEGHDHADHDHDSQIAFLGHDHDHDEAFASADLNNFFGNLGVEFREDGSLKPCEISVDVAASVDSLSGAVDKSIEEAHSAWTDFDLSAGSQDELTSEIETE